MQMVKKLLALILALVLVVSVAACGAEKAPDTKTSDATTAAGTKAEEPKPQELPFVTVTHHVMGDPPTNGQWEIVQAKWNEKMKEKINAHMELKWIEWADWYTKYNLLLASGEPIDMIHTSSTWLDMWPNAQKGSFLALDELIPKYAPTTWAEIKPEEWDQARYNGKIVAFPENSYSQYVNHGFYYRGDWAKEFGITEPIKDWATLGKYFQGIKDKKPGVIPWDANGTKNEQIDGWFVADTDSIGIAAVPTGYQKLVFAKSYDEKYTLYSPIFEDSYLNFAKMMKEWGDKGYWREDVMNYKGDTRALMRAGKS
jgi:putative aldouronate transport system substrate-binding protein